VRDHLPPPALHRSSHRVRNSVGYHLSWYIVVDAIRMVQYHTATSQRHIKRVAYFAENTAAAAHHTAAQGLAQRTGGLEVQVVHTALTEQEGGRRKLLRQGGE
jgi:hypothetical protein